MDAKCEDEREREIDAFDVSKAPLRVPTHTEIQVEGIPLKRKRV